MIEDYLGWLGLSKIELDTGQFTVMTGWSEGRRAIIICRNVKSEEAKP